MMESPPGPNLTIGRLMGLIAAIAVTFRFVPPAVAAAYAAFAVGLAINLARRPPLDEYGWFLVILIQMVWLTILVVAAWPAR